MASNMKKRESIRIQLVEHGLDPTRDVIMHGDAEGADKIGGSVAEKLGFKVVAVAADWHKFGKRAGPIRNQKMLNEKPDLCLAFHVDIKNSRGTRDMVERCQQAGIPVEVFSS